MFDAFRNKEGYIRAFARRFFDDRATVEDICQETIARALEAEQSRHVDSPDAFLFGVARNVVRRQLDSQSRALVKFVEDFTPDDYESGSPSVEEVVDDRERMLQFMKSVLKLPPQCQRVFVLKKVYGHSHKEISAKLGISISTIEKHVVSAMKRCLADLERESGEEAVTRRSGRRV